MPHRKTQFEDSITVFCFNVFIVGMEIIVDGVWEVVNRLNTVAPHVLGVFAFLIEKLLVAVR